MTIQTPVEPLAEQTYRNLRRQIILGHYRQGSRLVESTLASDLDVSRLPIREALTRLENEGFARSLPRRGSRVMQWTAADVTELFDARLSLETLAARLAARAAAAGTSLRPLQDAIEAEDRAMDSHDWLEAAEASTLVHEEVVAVGGSVLLGSLMRGISGRTTWLSYLTSDRERHQQWAGHHGLFEAIVTGNERLAESIAFAHIEQGRAPSLAILARD